MKQKVCKTIARVLMCFFGFNMLWDWPAEMILYWFPFMLLMVTGFLLSWSWLDALESKEVTHEE